MSFAELGREWGLSAPLLQAIDEMNYVAPTPVQQAAIPAILRGRDLLACAQTGSGKTAAFALPLLQRLAAEPQQKPRLLRGLILAPTRELAIQIGEALQAYAVHLQPALKIISVFGGVSINPQMMALRGGADIVVATPGRLLDLVDHNALRLDHVATLVLDEADRLFDLGFADELERILWLLPSQRQNLLFSATFPAAVNGLVERLLRDPERIDVAVTEMTAPAIEQRAITVDPGRRTQLLRHLIERHGWRQALVFVATRYATQHVAQKLRRAGIDTAALHGDLSQTERYWALEDFKAGRFPVLVATDVAARGLDISLLPAVVNYDLPRSADDYLHRIGRTGRAGETGVAISFVSAATEAHFRLIEKRHALALPREVVAGFEPTETAVATATAGNGGIKGKRMSKKDRLRAQQAQPSGLPTRGGSS